MAEIILRNGEICLVDEDDYIVLSAFLWRVDYGGYVVKSGGPRFVQMHQLIMNTIELPTSVYVDHENGDKLDNRKCNLRICTNSQNQANRHILQGTYSSYRGVTWHKGVGKWQAQIKVNQKSIYLGVFSTEIEAAQAYVAAAKQYFGKFANREAVTRIESISEAA